MMYNVFVFLWYAHAEYYLYSSPIEIWCEMQSLDLISPVPIKVIELVGF